MSPAVPPAFVTSSPLPLKPSAHHPRSAQRPRLLTIMVSSSVLPGKELIRPPPAELATNGPLTPSQIDTFFKQGYIVVPSLVPPDLLHRMQQAIPAVEAAKLGPPVKRLYDNLSFRIFGTDDAFKTLAQSSPVAAAAAQLTPTTSTSRGLIVLKDAYFRMQGENIGCGFHVDDEFFWPCPVDAPGPGVNAWIALHDVDEDGGGLTIAPRSHLSDFLDCREAIKGKTCLLAEIDPEKNQRLEDIAVSPQVKAGDVILHTRWMFHRGNPFRKGSQAANGFGIARYSVRYMPAEAVVNEISMVDGKFEHKPPVTLNDADPSEFPAVQL